MDSQKTVQEADLLALLGRLVGSKVGGPGNSHLGILKKAMATKGGLQRCEVVTGGLFAEVVLCVTKHARHSLLAQIQERRRKVARLKPFSHWRRGIPVGSSRGVGTYPGSKLAAPTFFRANT